MSILLFIKFELSIVMGFCLLNSIELSFFACSGEGGERSVGIIFIHLDSKQEKNWGNITSCKQLKYHFPFLLFYIKIAYFVRERIELFIGMYISMKSTFPFKPESSENGKIINICLAKTKQNNNKKNIDVKQ